MVIRKTLVLAFLTLMTGPCLAEMYKWTDDKGQVHYGQQAPENTQATPVKPPPGPSSSADSEKAALEQMQQAQQQAEEQTKMAEELEQKKADKLHIWQANCNAAKAQLTVLKAKPRIRKRSGIDELSVMPEDELKQKIAQTEKDIKLYCNPPADLGVQ